jgi:hypothetical protein
MKKNFYLMTALCAIILSACSGDTDPTPNTGDKKTAKIELSLTGTTTRATGATLPADDNTGEQTVSNIVIGIFNSAGGVLTIQGINNPNLSSQTISCPLTQDENGCTAVVVANVPTAKISTLTAATSRDNFLGVTLGLQETTASGGNAQLSNNLPMSGDVKEGANATFNLVSGATKTGLSVSLSRMVSRVTLTGIKTDFSSTGQYANATFKFKRIFLRNALSESKVTPSLTLGDNMEAAPQFVTGGGTWNTGTKVWDNDDDNYLFNEVGTVVDILPGTVIPTNLDYYWFYAFSNNSATSPTTLVIQGEFDTDGDGGNNPETVFYPVVINKNQVGTTITDNNGAVSGETGTITRNRLYNISVTIKGKGVSAPTQNIVPANLEIAVSVASWSLTIVQSVEFN